MESLPFAEIIGQVGVGGLLIWLLMQGANNFLEEQKERDTRRYAEMHDREEQWFELLRANSAHMATQNELLRQQNHLLKNVATQLGLEAAREHMRNQGEVEGQ